MKKISPSPSPPYICAVFTSIRTNINEGYEEMNNLLFNEIKNIDGYIGNEAFRDKDGFGVNISYWKDLVSLKKWKNNQLHICFQTIKVIFHHLKRSGSTC